MQLPPVYLANGEEWQAIEQADHGILSNLAQHCKSIPEFDLLRHPWSLARMGAVRFHCGSYALLAELAEDAAINITRVCGIPDDKVTISDENVGTADRAGVP